VNERDLRDALGRILLELEAIERHAEVTGDERLRVVMTKMTMSVYRLLDSFSNSEESSGAREEPASDENSKRSRVDPVFRWLRDNGGTKWPARLLKLVAGLQVDIVPGSLVRMDFEAEQRVPPSPRRLAWMIRNADRLVPQDGRRWRELRTRIENNPRREEALAKLDQGETAGLDRRLRLEGDTCADCLIECEDAVIWIEGKRNDWLSSSTDWDVTRDQLARNAEATSLYARARGKEFCLVVCHEGQLKHHEELLLHGYRSGTWSGGWPHLELEDRHLLGQRIGTLRWADICGEWPEIQLR
jgi:hypothetical protein